MAFAAHTEGSKLAGNRDGEADETFPRRGVGHEGGTTEARAGAGVDGGTRALTVPVERSGADPSERSDLVPVLPNRRRLCIETRLGWRLSGESVRGWIEMRVGWCGWRVSRDSLRGLRRDASWVVRVAGFYATGCGGCVEMRVGWCGWRVFATRCGGCVDMRVGWREVVAGGRVVAGQLGCFSWVVRSRCWGSVCRRSTWLDGW